MQHVCRFCGGEIARAVYRGQTESKTKWLGRAFCSRECYAGFTSRKNDKIFSEIEIHLKQGFTIKEVAERLGLALSLVVRASSRAKIDADSLSEEVKRKVVELSRKGFAVRDISRELKIMFKTVVFLLGNERAQKSRSTPIKERSGNLAFSYPVSVGPIPPATSCRFITNDDMRHPAWCDLPTNGKSSYCRAHADVCFMKT